MRTLVALVIACAALPPVAAGGDDGPTAAAFSKAVGAWQRRDAAGVVAAMPPDARLLLSLDGAGAGRVNGSPTRENAQVLLKGYFERLEGVSLKDVTTEPRAKTRAYDYGYRPRGGEAKATRLSFTLVAVEGGAWALAGVEERPRPR